MSKLIWVEDHPDEFKSLTLNSWDEIKAYYKGFIQNYHKEAEETPKLEPYLILKGLNKIVGKPQLVFEVKKDIPLTTLYIKETEDGKKIRKIFLLDEKHDKRSSGYQADVFSVQFYVYRVICQDLEYFVLSQEKLKFEMYDFSGLNIDLEDFSELGKFSKLNSKTNLFMVKSVIPHIKTLSQEELIKYTKDVKENINFGLEQFMDYMRLHSDGKVYCFSEGLDKLRTRQILSSKVDGYPLHLNILGSAGTGKTAGIIETTQNKFNEPILEGANSRPKSLEPSFKEKIADVGYIARCNRIFLIDELNKMVVNEVEKSHNASNTRYLGSLNFLLEHKERVVGSGNCSMTLVQATSKGITCSNPLPNRANFPEHLELIDSSYLSRQITWIMTPEERDYIFSKNGVKDFPEHYKEYIYDTNSPEHYENNIYNNNKKQYTYTSYSSGKYILQNIFLTIFDSCQAFLSDFDTKRVQTIVQGLSSQVKEPVKSQVWLPRALHHSSLLLDGIIKERCLFKDFDGSFKVQEKDYEELERHLLQIVKTWDTKFQEGEW